jgi:hypothetical protein
MRKRPEAVAVTTERDVAWIELWRVLLTPRSDVFGEPIGEPNADADRDESSPDATNDEPIEDVKRAGHRDRMTPTEEPQTRTPWPGHQFQARTFGGHSL